MLSRVEGWMIGWRVEVGKINMPCLSSKCQPLSMLYLIPYLFSQQACKVDIIPIVQMRNLRLREVK